MARFSVLSCSFVFLALFFSCNKAQEIRVYELKTGNFSVKFTNYGATMISLIFPDKNGKLSDVVLGYDSPPDYKDDTTYFGALVGRVANRIGGAKFTLNGTVYKTVANDGNNTLHGGPKGFAHVVWSVQSHKPGSHVTFTYNSPDGEQGFPGNLSVTVTYMLIGKNRLGVKMEAKPLNKATPVNLALHTYWNLGGQNSGNILSHEIQLFASSITPVNAQYIPTGEIKAVKGTPYDFLQPRVIGSRIKEVPGGYDMNYVIQKGNNSTHLTKTAVVREKKSGRKLELWTNQPGVQFYTSNMIDNVKGKGGFVYTKHSGLCLEAQGFPDSVNHPNFPSQIVKPGESYMNVMVFRFTAE